MDHFEEVDAKIRIRCWDLLDKYTLKNAICKWLSFTATEYDKRMLKVIMRLKEGMQILFTYFF